MTCQAALAPIAELSESDVINMLCDPTQLHVVFQPQVNLETGRIESAEALARWRHPALGMVAPSRFIPMVTAMELQGALFKRIARLTLAAATELDRAGIVLPLAINACADTLSDADNLNFLFDEARRSRVDASRLKIELTEDAPVKNMPALKAALSRLQDWGCTISMDDFGAGQANLGMLISLTINELKLDRKFAASISVSQVAQKSVRFAVELAKDMGWRVVAEGISTAAEFNAMYSLGCRYGQGFLLGRPMPLDGLSRCSR
ncbi:EAL domain-containing protein [Achromobacter seleniivolatilans]|uniref:EAL domain-containing protein n=1 Tax=Achromobacter seleniivolatilans TaxID=3047478 RepID=A0ABY9M2K1_9BURK|nr:EAL domain-containing protein [Achromobacter sp. R39]WMD20794.1 EAL domain-containing protein [Achromobacter sp. R39]